MFSNIFIYLIIVIICLHGAISYEVFFLIQIIYTHIVSRVPF